MKPHIFIVLLLLSLPVVSAFSQQLTLSGSIYDKVEKAPLEGAHLYLTNGDEEFSETTNAKGKFRIAQLNPGTYFMSVTYVGYQSYTDTLLLQEDLDLGKIAIAQIALNLDEIEITGKAPLATQSGDTTQYSSGAYKVNPDANAEDLIRKMPGVIFENGKAQAQGEEIKQVLVDGKPFFGDD
ncbi:MAG: carboxypeptidase regulatory-like domain-containing protein, partial [Mameliella sp.]|nr:carboxypeptidase regulatory-like domain-containing protein [Phaeodactylibacter sp.]